MRNFSKLERVIIEEIVTARINKKNRKIEFG